MTGPLSITSPPPRSTSEPSTHQLIQAARCVLRRFEVQPKNLQRALHMPYPTARAALDRLAWWGIVTPANGGARRLVLVRPEHEPDVVRALTEYGGMPPDPNPLVPLLTPALTGHLRRVLQLVAEGRSMDEVGAELGVTRNTVKTHVRKLYAAMGAHGSLANLVHLSHLKGVLPTPVFQSGKDSR